MCIPQAEDTPRSPGCKARKKGNVTLDMETRRFAFDERHVKLNGQRVEKNVEELEVLKKFINIKDAKLALQRPQYEKDVLEKDLIHLSKADRNYWQTINNQIISNYQFPSQ